MGAAPQVEAGQTAVVTGASAGIGRELARELARRGFDVLLAARSEGALETLARELEEAHEVDAHVVPVDLATAEGPDRVRTRIQELGLRVQVVANNAGFGQFGPYLELDGEAERDQLMLNVVALTRLTRLLLPEMVERGSGHVLNIASTAAFFPGPLMTVYYATKAYVLSYSVGLAEELRDSGVTVTCYCPGPTETLFTERAGMEESNLFKRQVVMEADEVARRGVAAALQGRRVYVPGLMNRLGAFASRLAPRPFAARAVKRIQGPD